MLTSVTRNISQTVQEREIVKTCPDIIVYIKGTPYLQNPYIYNANQPKNKQFTVVPFNDHVVAFSASFDVDQLTPSAMLTLTVPNHSKHLYQSPGGNNLIETMQPIQVFAKGYFPSSNGNTVYRRIFKGLISSVSHTDNGTILDISIQCLGIMHLLELTQIELNAALLSNSAKEVTPNSTNQAGLTPYLALADTFLRAVGFDGFQIASLSGATSNGNGSVNPNSQNPNLGSTSGDGNKSDWVDSVKANYISAWQKMLSDLQKDVYILGIRPFDVATMGTNGLAAPVEQGKMGPDSAASRGVVTAKISAIDQANQGDYYVDVIRSYLPEMSIGSIKLMDGSTTSRLERIRTLTNLLNYEGYQDVDGAIVFKPPFYNLDVTEVGNINLDGTNFPSPGSVTITNDTNPFVINLSEIETESETEDQSAIKETSVVVQPDWLPNFHFDGDKKKLPWSRHIDVFKLAKFGLREQPARQLPFLGVNDKMVLYTYAVSELNRANRGYRQYTMTIPLRPELKLGFPMYIPHKDMYGYIKTISFSYNFGAAATTTVMLDTIRKRPMFPATDASGNTIYTTQKNLVMKWTTPPPPAATSLSTALSLAGVSQYSYSSLGTNPSSSGCTTSDDPQANWLGNPATSRQPSSKPVYSEEWEVIDNKATAEDATFTGTGPTGAKVTISTQIEVGKPFFSADNWAKAKDTTTTVGGGSDPTTNSATVAQLTTNLAAAQKRSDDAIAALAVNSMQSSHAVGTTNSSAQKAAQTEVAAAAADLATVQAALAKAQATPSDTTQGVKAGTKTATGVNVVYMQKILNCQPLTDEKGYEVVTPFPWGRWKSLTQAIHETRLGQIAYSTDANGVSTDVSNPQGATTISGVNTFIFAGADMTGLSSMDPSTLMSQALNNTGTTAQDAIFELVTPTLGGTDSSLSTSAQPDLQALQTSLTDDEANRTKMFISGQAPVSDTLDASLNTITDAQTGKSSVYGH